MTNTSHTFLDSVRVLDLSRVLAGPLAGQILGDMGADVLKIEQPGQGDATRQWGPPFQGELSAYYQCCNRNKSSLELDLKSSEGCRLIRELLRRCDILLDNFPLDVAKRCGLSFDELQTEFPRLIHVHIASFANRSPRRLERGYDLALQAESGMMSVTGHENDSEGFKVGFAIIDVLAGQMASSGALAALFRREKTGLGAQIEVSLFQSALFGLVNVATNAIVRGRPGKRWGNAHPNIVPYQSFRCRDRPIVLAVGSGKQFSRLVDVLQLDSTWKHWKNPQRVAKRELISETIQNIAQEWMAEEFVERLRSENIPCAMIFDVSEALGSPSANLVAVRHAQVGDLKLVANPIEGKGMRSDHLAPPLLGEKGKEVVKRWLDQDFQSP